MSARRELHGAVIFFAIFVVEIVASPSGTCVSQGPRFPTFELEGKPPRKTVRGSDDLSLCRIFKDKTCCKAMQTQHALGMLKNIAVHGEASNDCLALWELLECSICDPMFGTSPGPPTLCHSFCDNVFYACSAAYYSMNVQKQILYPCNANDVLCARGKEWTQNSTRFCELAGFHVTKPGNHGICFDGRVASTEKASETVPPPAKKQRYVPLVERFHRIVMVDNVSWAIGGLVLTAGAAYFSYMQRGHRARQRRVALFKTINEVRARQQEALSKTVKQ